MITIENNIPIPSNSKTNGWTKVKALQAMTKGQSFVVPLRHRSMWTSAARLAKVKIVTRTVSESELRIWRAE